MKHRYFIKKLTLLPILSIFFMTSCLKEDDGLRQIILLAENLSQTQKAAVLDNKTFFVNGERLWINNANYQIASNNSNEAIAYGVIESNDYIYKAVYPSGVLKDFNGNNITVEVPKHNYYKEINGKQVLDNMPLVAYYDGSSISEQPSSLNFKHLTAAIAVRVKNEKEVDLTLDRIVIVNNKYKLGGEITFDISTVPSCITPIETNEADSITIHFIDITKKISANGFLDIQVPMLPIGSENSVFTIKVYGHYQGTRYTYNRSTASRNNTIQRACLGYAVAKFDSAVESGDLFETETIVVDGVSKNFFEIHSPDELITLSNAMDSLWSTHDGTGQNNQANYIVVNDIDMHGATMTPIHYYNLNGNERCYFDGQGYTISNFVASSVGENEPNCCGFFGRTAGDSITVKNLNIDNATYEFAHVAQTILTYDGNPCSAVGGIYAVVDKEGIVIENCTVTNIKMGSTGNVMSGENQTDFYASGIVGLAHKGVTIRNCYIGTVDVDNSNDASSKALVDQFGAAIGRIDVGNSSGSNTYEKAGDNCTKMIIENVTYEQGNTPLVFDAELKNIRYGGLVANITRGGILKIINCAVSHNVIVYKPTANLYCGGIIGCNKLGLNMGFYLDANCNISGNIENRAVTSYTSGYQIEKYIGNGVGKIVKIDNSASTCNNTLTVSGNTTSFKSSNQHF